jgi:adenylate cyclase
VLLIRVLGPPLIEYAGQIISGLPKRGLALISFLATEKGRIVSRDKLVDLLWPDVETETGRHRLRNCLLSTRSRFGEGGFQHLISQDNGLKLPAEGVTTDADEFRKLAASSDRLSLAAAARLYRGELLAEMSPVSPVFDDWLRDRRNEFSEIAASVFARLSEACSAAADHTEAIAAGQKLVGIDRLSEEAHRILIRAYARAGRTGSALRQFRECSHILQDEFSVKPSPETTALVEELECLLPKKPSDGVSIVAKSPQQALPPLPEKPSLAVLPFVNMSPDPEQEYFADGMVEEMTTALGRIRSFFVVARNSSFTFKGRSVDVRQVGRELGVRYVLQGSIRREGDLLRISCELAEAETGHQIWGDRFKGTRDDVFALQDRITESVVCAIEPRLRGAEIQRAQKKPTDDLGAYDLYLRALSHFSTHVEQESDSCLALLRRALRSNPAFALAHALLAYAHVVRHAQGWVRAVDFDEGLNAAKEAARLDREDPTVLRMAGHAFGYFARDYPKALSLIDRALSLHPNSAQAFVNSGWNRIYGGDPIVAAEHFKQALRLSPLDPERGFSTSGLAAALNMIEQYDDALRWANEAVTDMPAWITGHRARLFALYSLERFAEARETGATIMKISPDYTVSLAFSRMPHRDVAYKERVASVLRDCGVPD